MNFKAIAEAVIIGTALQAVIGWDHPLTLVFTGFVAGVIARDKRSGTISGLAVGIINCAGLLLWTSAGLPIPFIDPAEQLVDALGTTAIYGIAASMVAFGLAGGYIGGAVVQGWIEDSYRRGVNLGEAKKEIREFRSEARRKR
ncbi:MAG: hypothetical protein KGH98_04475 [Candidatus Micrarchaeota archaeon]|nr:hypothetical protein [Candidatus Micrarchaeota archaeon]